MSAPAGDSGGRRNHRSSVKRKGSERERGESSDDLRSATVPLTGRQGNETRRPTFLRKGKGK